MSEKTNNNNRPKVNVPRPSLTWLYVLIALVFIFLYISSDGGSISKEVTYSKFQEMIGKGYASKIVAYDNNTAEMYIKPEHIVDVFQKDASKVGRSPAVQVNIPSTEALDKFLDEEAEKGNFTGEIKYDKKNDYFGAIFWNIVPILFFIALWLFPYRIFSAENINFAPSPKRN